MVRVTKVISIEMDQQKWLSQHPEINLSGFVQKQLRRLMEAEQDKGDLI